MVLIEKYDETDSKSIESYAQKLIGLNFQDVLDMDSNSEIEESTKKHYGNRKSKGGLGELVERHFFHYEPNTSPNPDFPKAGCELKVTPFKKNKNGSYSAKERLVLSKINYMEIVNESFETSHFWYKSRLLLLIYYLWRDNVEKFDYEIKFAGLFSPSKQDLEIIKNDFYTIQNKVKEGRAHELSCSDTLYLEACTKASTSSERTSQPNCNIKAKPRAFAFKASYMTYVLNNYFMNDSQKEESIIKKSTSTPFEEYIIKKISKYKNKSIKQLCSLFQMDFIKKPKNLEALLAYRMLGIKGNSASEFQKAGIAVKAIRISNNNTIKEHMSFSTFRFKDLVQETWDTSAFRNYLDNTRFFFVVYKYDDNNDLRFKGCQFWNMPHEDIEYDVKKVWRKTRRVINHGIVITTKNGVDYNNFPSPSENRVCHVRPHARNKKDTYELPNGGEFTKQSFWLNNSYILEQLSDELKQ